MAKQVLFLTQIICSCKAGPAITIACAVDPSTPFNPIWFLKRITLLIDSQMPIFGKFITLTLIYFFWQAIPIQGCRLTTDVIIGTI